MARYFEAARTVLERHGGTVEKFIGDAVMAVFGVPPVHEDDALRALRAAVELRDGLADLNEELERAYGTRLELRIGVNTGEVVTGTEERIATGDAVNVAARLEQAARPGEVLVGAQTLRLVRNAVEVEPVAPIEAKGKAEPIRASRLLAVSPETAARSGDVPMVGRERQRKLLEDVVANAVGERSCQLFTVLGPAGVGKSRLVAEFLRSLEGATVARGRCLSYGEGVGYWPVTEVVKQLLGDSEGEGAPGALGAILGDTSAAGSSDEIAWAFRKLLEKQAAEHPLVVVFDDVHWGESVFLDLVEHVADLSRDASILVLCLARPELLDHRSAWGGGKLNATNVLLEPLGPDESSALLDALVHEEIDVAPARPDSPVGCRQPALRRGDGGVRGRARPDRRLRAADDASPARCAARPTRQRRARRAGAWIGRRAGLPQGSGGCARARGGWGRRAPDHTRAEGPRPPGGAGDRRRRGIPLSPSPDPGHGVRVPFQGGPRRAARTFRGMAPVTRAAARGTGRARRVPPRAGLPLPRRARTARRCLACTRGAGGRSSAPERRSRARSRRQSGPGRRCSSMPSTSCPPATRPGERLRSTSP